MFSLVGSGQLGEQGLLRAHTLPGSLNPSRPPSINKQTQPQRFHSQTAPLHMGSALLESGF